MNPRLTDRERILILEARNRELEDELREWRRREHEVVADTIPSELVDKLRGKLRAGQYEAGGASVARMLLALLDGSPRYVSREKLQHITSPDRYGPRSDDSEGRTIDVQLVHLRRALANLGHPDVIKTLRSRGWMIEPEARNAIRAALAV